MGLYRRKKMPEVKPKEEKAQDDVLAGLKEPGSEFEMVVFSIEGCPPCKALSEAIKELEKEYLNVDFKKVEGGDDLDVDIFMYPTVLISNGEFLLKTVGGSGSVSTDIQIYSRVFDALDTGEIELDYEENKAVIDGEIEFTVEEIE